MHISFSRARVLVLPLVIFCASLCFAQFSASVQGVVQDPSGAGIANASVQIVNSATQVSRTVTSDDSGNFVISSLAPGSYSITAQATGFAKSKVDFTLLTEQHLNVPIAMNVGSVTESVTVTTEAPIVDTADSRIQMTLQNQAVAQLPVIGRNLVTLVTMAPGVSGLGTAGNAGAPASGIDNFSTEEAVDASANGQGSDNNQYVVDGLDVTSGIRQGVLNLTPTPDSIQETSIQVNTFSVEHARAAGIVTAFTTKSGTDQFHGSAADYFTYQKMFALQHFQGPYKPFHQNDLSFSIGGPVIPHHGMFFYFAVEPKRASAAAGNQITFPDAQFLNFIQATPALAATVGTHILTTYLPQNLSGVTVFKTAQGILGTDPSAGCNTAATNNIPCTLPMIDQGLFSATSVRNGTQYFGRIDQEFKKDRIYVSLFRTLLTTGAAAPTPAFSALNPTWQVAGQATWTHTFSPTTLNDFSAGQSRVEGKLATGEKDYTVPNITAGISEQLGAGFAQGDFIQHNYHWRDILTHVQGAHTLKFGYEGWYGDDVENFQGPWATPSFNFTNILTLAQDAPLSESGVFYNPTTGQQQNASWNAASRTFGIYAEDTWKATRKLTLTLGLRYDDSGNPWSKSPTTVFGNFYLGTGSTYQEQVSNGFAKATHNALLHAVNGLVSPRIGFAWDPSGKGDWAIRGGGGIFDNWLTNANVQEEFRGNPPGLYVPTFVPGGTATAQGSIFQQGTGNTPPFGFNFPLVTSPGLNAQGGVPGLQLGVSGINPLLKSPQAEVWSLAVEKKLTNNLSASVGYSGSHTYDIASGGNSIVDVNYGVNINVLPDDFIIHNTASSAGLSRLNPSFGSINYTANDRIANYNGIFFDLKGHFGRGFLDVSYTRSRSQDDAGNYPTPFNPRAYYGPSPWDVPNRISATYNYSLKGLNGGQGAVGVLTGGWGLSGTTVYQSGEPITIAGTNSYQPVCTPGNLNPCPSVANPAIGYGLNSGDFNADGVNNDYPDVVSYKQNNSKNAFLSGGSIPISDFGVPTFGSEGNEKTGQFRQPSYFGTNVNFYKDTRLTERVNFELRFEFFNIFNRANLTNIDTHFTPGNTDANFGLATNSQLPRFWQLGGKIMF
jgi:hypothetical protein